MLADVVLEDGLVLASACSPHDRAVSPAWSVDIKSPSAQQLPTAPIAQQAIDIILELYCVEHDAKEQRIVGTDAHLVMRRQRAGPVRMQLKHWLDEQLKFQLPKSPIGVAIRYATRALGRTRSIPPMSDTPQGSLSVSGAWAHAVPGSDDPNPKGAEQGLDLIVVTGAASPQMNQ